MPFRGSFDHTLDAKNRLTVPTRFRAALADGLVLVRTPGTPCLSVWPAQAYAEQTSAALSGLNPLSREARELKRMFSSTALETELDAAGRIQVPAKFLAHARLTRETTIVGADDCFEVWDRGAWEAYDEQLTARAEQLTENLGRASAA